MTSFSPGALHLLFLWLGFQPAVRLMKLGDPLKENVTSHCNGEVTCSLAHKNFCMVAMQGQHRMAARMEAEALSAATSIDRT
jgi:hypothetical protein